MTTKNKAEVTNLKSLYADDFDACMKEMGDTFEATMLACATELVAYTQIMHRRSLALQKLLKGGDPSAEHIGPLSDDVERLNKVISGIMGAYNTAYKEWES